MSWVWRVSLEFFGPTLLVVAKHVVLDERDAYLDMLRWGWGGVVEALLLLGSVMLAICVTTFPVGFFYTLLMEWRYTRGLEPRSGKGVGVAALVGVLMGVTGCLPLLFAGARGWVFLTLYYGAQGLVMGLILGLLVKFLTPRIPPVLAGR